MFFGRFMSFKLRNNSFWLGMLVMVNQLFKKKMDSINCRKEIFYCELDQFWKD